MHYMRWLMRAKRWQARPPSEKMVKMVLGLIVAGVLIASVERWVGWPAWAQLDPVGPRSAVQQP